MSEIRQRKGEASAESMDEKDREIARLKAQLMAQEQKPQSAEKKKDQPEPTEDERKQMVEEISQALRKTAPNQVKGLSNEAKVFKDKLAADPFNMDLIFELGAAYGKDQQWDKCLNILLRGWKRASEFQNPDTRYEFLCLLAQASHKEKKFRQALAILQDIEEPEEKELKSNFELFRCQVYCDNGDMQRGLKSLNKAIEGQEFDKAAAIWANCLSSLKKAGAYDVSKSTMSALANSKENKDKLEAMEKLAGLRDQYYATQVKQPVSDAKKYVTGIGIGVLVVVGLYLLYLLESMSLSKMKDIPGSK